MALIGMSGKIGSGKDTVGTIIQIICFLKKMNIPYSTAAVMYNWEKNFKDGHYYGDWQIKKYAAKLKQIVALLTGCDIKDLESQEFKNKALSEEWIRYSYATGFTKDNNGNTTMIATQCSKEKYEEEFRTNWQTAYKHEFTYRTLLQFIGTNAMRDVIHENIWVNALFADFKTEEKKTVEGKADLDPKTGKYIIKSVPIGFNLESQIGTEIMQENWVATVPDYSLSPNWIITDMRFPNELQAVKEHGGFTIRVNRIRNNSDLLYNKNLMGEMQTSAGLKDTITEHPSETALDTAEFDYTIDNSGTIEELIEKVNQILIKAQII